MVSLSWDGITARFEMKFDEVFLTKSAKGYFDSVNHIVVGAKGSWKLVLMLDAIICHYTGKRMQLPFMSKRVFNQHTILREVILAEYQSSKEAELAEGENINLVIDSSWQSITKIQAKLLDLDDSGQRNYKSSMKRQVIVEALCAYLVNCTDLSRLFESIVSDVVLNPNDRPLDLQEDDCSLNLDDYVDDSDDEMNAGDAAETTSLPADDLPPAIHSQVVNPVRFRIIVSAIYKIIHKLKKAAPVNPHLVRVERNAGDWSSPTQDDGEDSIYHPVAPLPVAPAPPVQLPPVRLAAPASPPVSSHSAPATQTASSSQPAPLQPKPALGTALEAMGGPGRYMYAMVRSKGNPDDAYIYDMKKVSDTPGYSSFSSSVGVKRPHAAAADDAQLRPDRELSTSNPFLNLSPQRDAAAQREVERNERVKQLIESRLGGGSGTSSLPMGGSLRHHMKTMYPEIADKVKSLVVAPARPDEQQRIQEARMRAYGGLPPRGTAVTPFGSPFLKAASAALLGISAGEGSADGAEDEEGEHYPPAPSPSADRDDSI